MELLSQLDGFESLGQVKIVMATNRPDMLDPALLRPGRLDRKIEIPLPNDTARGDILRIHAGPIAKKGEIGEWVWTPCASRVCGPRIVMTHAPVSSTLFTPAPTRSSCLQTGRAS